MDQLQPSISKSTHKITTKGSEIGAVFEYCTVENSTKCKSIQDYSEHVFRITVLKSGGVKLENVVTKDAVGAMLQESVRKKYWEQLSQHLTWQEMWAHWVVYIFHQNVDSICLKELNEWLYKICLAIKNDFDCINKPPLLELTILKYLSKKDSL